MSATAVDSSFGHLFPAFRDRLEAILAETGKLTGHKWVMAEGFRSQERQSWLYAQGRTRPGKIVTWMKVPVNHGAGLAADCYPTSDGKTPDFSLSHSNYVQFRACYLTAGLTNPAWAKGDYGHVQWPSGDGKTQSTAKLWVRQGFPPSPAPTPFPEVPVYVDGDLLPDADAYRGSDGSVYVALRPVAEALEWQIKDATPPEAVLEDNRVEASVPIVIKGGRGFSPVRPLCEALGVALVWDEAKKAVHIG